MNILAVDSCTDILSVSLDIDGKTLTYQQTGFSRHAEHIITAIDTVMQQGGIQPRELDLLLCPLGPGSFTGLRLSWAALRGIELAAQCPLVGIPVLDCWAYPWDHWPGAVISVMDAKRNHFYARFFRKGKPVSDAVDIGPEQSCTFLDPEERILITGPDAPLFRDQLCGANPLLDCVAAPPPSHGLSVLFIDFAKKYPSCYTQGMADHEGPLYVRKSDAEESQS